MNMKAKFFLGAEFGYPHDTVTCDVIARMRFDPKVFGVKLPVGWDAAGTLTVEPNGFAVVHADWLEIEGDESALPTMSFDQAKEQIEQ